MVDRNEILFAWKFPAGRISNEALLTQLNARRYQPKSPNPELPVFPMGVERRSPDRPWGPWNPVAASTYPRTRAADAPLPLVPGPALIDRPLHLGRLPCSAMPQERAAHEPHCMRPLANPYIHEENIPFRTMTGPPAKPRAGRVAPPVYGTPPTV